MSVVDSGAANPAQVDRSENPTVITNRSNNSKRRGQQPSSTLKQHDIVSSERSERGTEAIGMHIMNANSLRARLTNKRKGAPPDASED